MILYISLALNLYLLYFIAKRFYYHKVPPVLWSYDIAMLGDSHIERGNWNQLLGCNVANFGKGKSTVEQMYHRLPGVINCRPKVCFIHGGINDIQQGIPVDTTLEYFTRIIEGLREAGIRPVIIEVIQTGFPDINKQVDELNLKLRDREPTIPVSILPDDLSDGLHMKGAGYSKWALAVMEFLQAKQ